jgi:alpha-L-arabinofuranosidase
LYSISTGGDTVRDLVKHAKYELELAGFFGSEIESDKETAEYVFELIKVFSKQIHSTTTAKVVRLLFDKLSNHEHLTEITDNPDEWDEFVDSRQADKKLKWQSNRNPCIFSTNRGKTFYDIEDAPGTIKLSRNYTIYKPKRGKHRKFAGGK